MNLNLTFWGQTIAFIVFVFITMRYVWPMLTNILDARKKTIADGLAAGEKGRHELELADKRAGDVIREAKTKAADIINHAERRASEIADEAKEHARTEAERIIHGARAEIEQETNSAREQLRGELSALVVSAASQVIEKEIDAATHAKLINSAAAEL